MIKAEVIDALVAAGCTAEQLAAAIKADQARSSGADRQARYRARKASQRDERDITSVTVTDDLSPKKETSPTPPKEKTTPIPLSEAEASSSGRVREFDQFWSLFPNKVGKGDAAKAFSQARKRADLETILAGVRRYAAKADDRPWCNPGTFLNQDRWADQPADPPPRHAASPPANGKRNYADVVMDRMAKEQKNGHHSISGDRGDVELLPPDRSKPRPDDGLNRGGIGRRFIPDHH